MPEGSKHPWRKRLMSAEEIVKDADELAKISDDDRDMYPWKSMLCYTQPWVLYGQVLTKPLCQVIGQITVPDDGDGQGEGASIKSSEDIRSFARSNETPGPSSRHRKKGAWSGLLMFVEKFLARRNLAKAETEKAQQSIVFDGQVHPQHETSHVLTVEQNAILTRMHIVAVIMTSTWVFLIACMDIAFFLYRLAVLMMLQTDPTCAPARTTPPSNIPGNPGVMAVHCVIIMFHIVEQFGRMTEVDDQGEMAGLASVIAVSSDGLTNLSATFVNTGYLCAVVCSTFLVPVHYSFCSAPPTDQTYLSIWVAESTAHVIRIILAFARCNEVLMQIKMRVRGALSSNRRRYIDDVEHFDLDITYIVDRIIAMSLPVTGHQLYHNEIRDVRSFLASRHYGSFLVFNLCEYWEEGGNANYDPALLFYQVNTQAQLLPPQSRAPRHRPR